MRIMKTRHNGLLPHQARHACKGMCNLLRSFFLLGFLSIASFSLLPIQTAFALTVPTPRVKPAPPALSQFLTDSDARHLRKAISAAKRRDWREFDRSKSNIKDNLAKDLLVWIRVTRDTLAPQDLLTYAAHNLSDWPRQTTIRARAEANLFDRASSPSETIAWFRGQEPVSGEGRAALARANYALGNNETADMWLRSAWRDSKLTRDRQKRTFSEFRSKLTREDHAHRADHLIWNGRRHFTKAQALLPHMSSDERKLMDARLRVAANRSGMDRAINAVPVKYKEDTGLLFERARWRRIKKTKDYALTVYKDIKGAPINETGREALWREDKLMTYWLISEKKFEDAYHVVLNHGFSRGAAFAEAEFLAGWLALRKLNNPRAAQTHFQKLSQAVTTPVSLSRGFYWLARSQSGLDATLSYQRAAQYPNTFYGQLAIAALAEQAPLLVLPSENGFEIELEKLRNDRRVKAMKLLAEAGDERLYSQFSFHLDDVLQSPEELAALGQIAKDYGYMRPAIRAAKQAGRFQTMLTESGYPIVQVIENMPDKFEKAFVYAIARQETEFETNAISSARAYGLMQMINATAKYTARKHRIPYNQSRLLSDADYAASLGAYHLNDLLERWDGSYVLAAVSYNAGPHRAKQWIAKYGDPRTGEIDPIDWIESTPFSETRNYVQRVLENMQVYRARRNGNVHPLNIERDLRYGQQ